MTPASQKISLHLLDSATLVRLLFSISRIMSERQGLWLSDLRCHGPRMRATQVTKANLFQNKARHRPACPGDPISLFEKQNGSPGQAGG